MAEKIAEDESRTGRIFERGAIIVSHIGTRTSLYLLQAGLVPCKNSGKKTRCYKIAKKDVAEYLYRREFDPM